MCIVPNYVHLTQPIKILPQDLMHQSIPPAPSPPPLPRDDPREIAFFLPWMANSRGWGRKKKANAPSSVNTATLGN